jgi:hypothetical protein
MNNSFTPPLAAPAATDGALALLVALADPRGG